MRALITGVDGFLGANLAAYLLAAGHEVTGAALNRKNNTSLDALGVRCRVEYGDITDAAFVGRVVNACEAEVVYHLAAVSIVRVAERDPGRAIRTNVLGTLNVCEAAQRNGAKVIVASSDKAYGASEDAYSERTPLRPTGAYEVSKAAQDHVARLYGAIVVRAANLYGPGDLHWSRLVPACCRLIASGQAPQVYGDAGGCQREWLHIEDASAAYAFLAEHGARGQAYNVGSGQRATALDVARRLSFLGHAPCPDTVGKERPFYEIPSQSLDCTKIETLGWQARRTLNEGLYQTLHWYARHLCGMGAAA